jgi:transposase
MPRRAPQLECTLEVRQQLSSMSRSRSEEARLVERARIILACLEGKENQEVAQEQGLAVATVSKWRKRFAERGLKGLGDRPRPGKKPIYDNAFRNRLLAVLEEEPPKGMARWDGASLAARLEASVDAVWRTLRREGIYLERLRSWCVSTDPEFGRKAVEIVGLYVNPPVNALVFSVDEKPSMQAIERARGYVETDSGKVVRALKSTYKRHGTLNLFAALEVSSGYVHTAMTEQKKRKDFLGFLDAVVADLPLEKEIHVILDNYSTHKKNDDWLDKYAGRVKFHFTPTSASWLNQVEIWFSILERKTLRSASFHNKEQLQAAIEAFTARHNQQPKPFRWRKREVKGSQLRNTIVNLRN